MGEDLLTRIQHETHERLRELRDAVDEHERLQGELRVLDAAPELPAEPDVDSEMSAAPEPVPELPVTREAGPEPSATLDTESGSPIDPEPSTNVMRLPVRSRVPRTRIVSPKVARLMGAPRRPALARTRMGERAGVVRGGAGRVDSLAEETVEEVDVEAALYECSI